MSKTASKIATESSALLPPAGNGESKATGWADAFLGEGMKGNCRQIFLRANAPRSGPSILILDGLRAIAFLWVIVEHFSARTNMPLPAPDAQQGVVIFFVLSGYLIAMIVGGYLRKPGATFWPVFGKFMAGRFFRIWPAYMVSILIIQIYYSLLKGHGAFDACGYPGGIARAMTEYGLFLQNWLAPSRFGNDGVVPLLDPTTFADSAAQQKYTTMGAPGCMVKQASVAWTVQTEVNLYFMTPPLVYVYHKSRRLGWAAVGVVLLLSLGARFMVATLYHDTLRLDVNFATRAFYMRANEYCVGLLTYFAVTERANRAKLQVDDPAISKRSAATVAAEAAVLVALSAGTFVFNWAPEVFGIDRQQTWYQVYYSTFYYLSTALPFGALVYLATGPESSKFLLRPVNSLLSSSWLYPFASLSYTGYLLQGVVMEPIVLLDQSSAPYSVAHWANMLLLVVSSCVVAFALSMTIERPFMKIGREVIANFNMTAGSRVMFGAGAVAIVAVSAFLLVMGSVGPWAPPQPTKTWPSLV